MGQVFRLITALLLLAGPALAGDSMDQERPIPASCKKLHKLTEKCRLDGCDVREIEAWRERCKQDSTRG